MQKSNIRNSKEYDLEDRTARFALSIRTFIKSLKSDIVYSEDHKQLLRSSGSIAANYIEANESLTKKEFTHRVGICRKEAKETQLWLRLLLLEEGLDTRRKVLLQESIELTKIFGAIVEKCKGKNA